MNHNVFVNLMYDASFKAVYMDRANKGLLINLINQILPDEVEKVQDIIEYLDRELSSDISLGKSSRLDMICLTDTGDRVIVELQRKSYSTFMDRCLYYMSDVYRRQLEVGMDYQDLHSVYLISILDYAYPHEDERQWDSDHFISRYCLKEIRTGEIGTKKFFINFAETKRFTKSLEECRDEKDFLFYWFLHGWEFEKGSMPEQFENFPRMRELVRASEIAAFSAEKKLKYDTEIMTELDQLNYEMEQKRLNLAKGYASGHQDGYTEGENNKALEMARKMKADGVPVENIIKYSGLSKQRIEEL